eukprot:gene23489-17308_t
MSPDRSPSFPDMISGLMVMNSGGEGAVPKPANFKQSKASQRGGPRDSSPPTARPSTSQWSRDSSPPRPTTSQQTRAGDYLSNFSPPSTARSMQGGAPPQIDDFMAGGLVSRSKSSPVSAIAIEQGDLQAASDKQKANRVLYIQEASTPA